MLAVVAGIVASSIGGRNGSAEQLGKAWKMRARLQLNKEEDVNWVMRDGRYQNGSLMCWVS